MHDVMVLSAGTVCNMMIVLLHGVMVLSTVCKMMIVLLHGEMVLSTGKKKMHRKGLSTYLHNVQV